jgi:hypothetical protein
MKSTFITLYFCIATIASHAQTACNINLNTFAPKASFQKNITTSNFGGLGIGFLKANKKNAHIEYGGSIGVAMYGYREYNVTFTSPIDNTIRTTRVYEDDCLTQLGFQARYVLKTKNVLMPYANANLGLNSFFTHLDPFDKNIGYKGQFVWLGHSLTAGCGFGTRINLFKLVHKKLTKNVLMLDLNKSYTAGTKASYRNFENMEAPKEDLTYGIKKSSMFYSSFSVGLVFYH